MLNIVVHATNANVFLLLKIEIWPIMDVSGIGASGSHVLNAVIKTRLTIELHSNTEEETILEPSLYCHNHSVFILEHWIYRIGNNR